jgi:hypothetical protein
MEIAIWGRQPKIRETNLKRLADVEVCYEKNEYEMHLKMNMKCILEPRSNCRDSTCKVQPLILT